LLRIWIASGYRPRNDGIVGAKNFSPNKKKGRYRKATSSFFLPANRVSTMATYPTRGFNPLLFSRHCEGDSPKQSRFLTNVFSFFLEE
jgi:hypothetical protein